MIVVVTIINTIIKPLKMLVEKMLVDFMEQGAVTITTTAITMVHLSREYPNKKIKVYPNLMVRETIHRK
jgi:hypothetical protein